MSSPQTDTLDERIDRLEMRLDPGFTRIGAALAQGIDVTKWEDVWVGLLAEYVALEDEKAAHHAEVRQQVELAAMPRKEVAV